MKKGLLVLAMLVVPVVALVGVPNAAATHTAVVEETFDDMPTAQWPQNSTDIVYHPTGVIPTFYQVDDCANNTACWQGGRNLAVYYNGSSIAPTASLYGGRIHFPNIDFCQADKLTLHLRYEPTDTSGEVRIYNFTAPGQTDGAIVHAFSTGKWRLVNSTANVEETGQIWEQVVNEFQVVEITEIDCVGGSARFTEPALGPSPSETEVISGIPNLNENGKLDTIRFLSKVESGITVDYVAVDMGTPLPHDDTQIRNYNQVSYLETGPDDTVASLYAWRGDGVMERLNSGGSVVSSSEPCHPTVTGESLTTDNGGLFNAFAIGNNNRINLVCDIIGGGITTDNLYVYKPGMIKEHSRLGPSTDRTLVYAKGANPAHLYVPFDSDNIARRAADQQGTPFTTLDCPAAGDMFSVWGDRSSHASKRSWAAGDCGVVWISAGSNTELADSSKPSYSVVAYGDTVILGRTNGDLERYELSGDGTSLGTFTHNYTFQTSQDGLYFSWDGRYVLAYNAAELELLDASDLSVLKSYTPSSTSLERCVMDASNNYIYCSDISGVWRFDAFPYTVSENGDGANATVLNPTAPADAFGTSAGSADSGVDPAAPNTGVITPNEPKSVVGVDVVAIGDNVIGDGDLFAVIVALAVIGGVAAAGAIGGAQVGIPLWGGVGGGVLAFFGTVMLGWIPVWMVVFIFLLGAAVLVYRFNSGGGE